MRWLRLIIALLQAKLKSKILATDTASLTFRVWITDIDVSVMNHAAILTVMETGRTDFMVRTGFLRLAMKNKWYFPSQAISAQFYRPLKVFQKATLYTRLSFVDDKWIYTEQKIMRQEKEIASCLVKSTIKKGRNTVPTEEIIKALQIVDLPRKKSELIENCEQVHGQMKAKLIDHWKI